MSKGDRRLPYMVGNQIKSARLDRGMSQEDLARKSGISRSQIAQWESQIRNPMVQNFERIAYALRMSPEELMHYHSAPEVETQRFAEEAAADPIGFRIKLINTLLLGLSEKGLDEIIKIANDMIRSEGEYAKELTPGD